MKQKQSSYQWQTYSLELNKKRQRTPRESSPQYSAWSFVCFGLKLSINDAGVIETPCKENISIQLSCWMKSVLCTLQDCTSSATVSAASPCFALNPETLLERDNGCLLHELNAPTRQPSSRSTKSENHLFFTQGSHARFISMKWNRERRQYWK